jgi:hypothetical protein
VTSRTTAPRAKVEGTLHFDARSDAQARAHALPIAPGLLATPFVEIELRMLDRRRSAPAQVHGQSPELRVHVKRVWIEPTLARPAPATL